MRHRPWGHSSGGHGSRGGLGGVPWCLGGVPRVPGCVPQDDVECRGVPWGTVGCRGVSWGAVECRGVPRGVWRAPRGGKRGAKAFDSMRRADATGVRDAVTRASARAGAVLTPQVVNHNATVSETHASDIESRRLVDTHDPGAPPGELVYTLAGAHIVQLHPAVARTEEHLVHGTWRAARKLQRPECVSRWVILELATLFR